MSNKQKVASEKVDLRRGIDYIGVTVNFLVHDGNGKILLHKRSKNCRDEQGKWDIGGGAVEFGETLDEAVRRELKEELCVEPIELSAIQHYDAHRNNDGVATHWIAIMYLARVNPNEVKIGEPHKIDDIGWFTKDALPTPRHSMFDKAYKMAITHNILK